ncbi:MAG TPA: DnaA/Hda family protein [Planctomycetota bacterium]|nr:DnaA/Hda family protein [Planctomycetota bacterium]
MEVVSEPMSTQAHAALWEALQEDFRLKLGGDLYDRWIAPLKLVSSDGARIQLGTSNLFVLDWIRKRYLPDLERVLRQRHGDEVALELVIDPELFREHRLGSEKVLGPEARGSSGALTAELSSTPTASPDAPSLSASDVSSSSLASLGQDPAASFAPGYAPQRIENFIVGETNRYAYNAALEALERPGGLYNPLFIHGPSGVGKTHLLKGLYQAYRSRRKGQRFLRVAYLTGEQYFQQYVASIQDRALRRFQERSRALDVLILDDVHLLVSKKKTQLEFLHTFSTLADSGAQIILASDVPPKCLKDLEAGLVGRFLSGLQVGIRRPDYATRLGIARAQARGLSCTIDEDTLRYLAENVKGNAREVLGAVKLLHHHFQVQGGPLSPKAAQKILAELSVEFSRRVDLRKIHEVVARHFGLAAEKLVSASRERHVAFARQVAMYLARRCTGKSLAEVGKYLGNRNYATVRCAEKKITKLLERGEGRLSVELGAILEALED